MTKLHTDFYEYMDGELAPEQRASLVLQLEESKDAQALLGNMQAQKDKVNAWLSHLDSPDTESFSDQLLLEKLQKFHQKRQERETKAKQNQPTPLSWWQKWLERPFWLAVPATIALFLLILAKPNDFQRSLGLADSDAKKLLNRQKKPNAQRTKLGHLRPKGQPIEFDVLYRSANKKMMGNTPIGIAHNKKILYPGDLVQFRFKLQQPAQGMVISINSKGEVFPFVPFRGRKSLLLGAGQNFIPAAASLELDDYVGPERFLLVVSQKSFTFGQLKHAIHKSWNQNQKDARRRIELPTPWYTASILIEKRKTVSTH